MRHAILCVLISPLFSGFSPLVMAADTDSSVIEKAVDAGFSELERQLIRKYFGVDTDSEKETGEAAGPNKKEKKKGLPPGLAKKEKLPPGLERQLQRNGTLPPGLAKRELPADLEQELPEPATGFERAIVENTVVLVERATGRIADIIEDVIAGE